MARTTGRIFSSSDRDHPGAEGNRRPDGGNGQGEARSDAWRATQSYMEMATVRSVGPSTAMVGCTRRRRGCRMLVYKDRRTNPADVPAWPDGGLVLRQDRCRAASSKIHELDVWRSSPPAGLRQHRMRRTGRQWSREVAVNAKRLRVVHASDGDSDAVVLRLDELLAP
jgi:hypothetical protein